MSERPPQLTREHLANMTPHQIRAARKEGLLDDLLSGKPEPTPEAEAEESGPTPGGADQGARGPSTPRPFSRAC